MMSADMASVELLSGCAVEEVADECGHCDRGASPQSDPYSCAGEIGTARLRPRDTEDDERDDRRRDDDGDAVSSWGHDQSQQWDQRTDNEAHG
jgi:hypothetical protein